MCWLVWTAGVALVFALPFAGVSASRFLVPFVTVTSFGALAMVLVEGYRATARATDHHPDKPFRLDWRTLSGKTVADDFGDPELRKRIDDFDRARMFLAGTSLLNMLLMMATYTR